MPMIDKTSFPFQRICVVGTTGCGKSRLASELAKRKQIPHIELDSLYWGANWTHCSAEEMRRRTERATRGNEWVVDGNYSSIRDLTWPRAEAVVWLDYSLPRILWQLWKRTWERVIKKEILWGSNKERLLPQFFSKDSLFLWALKTYKRHKQTYRVLAASPEYGAMVLKHFKSPRETRAWMNSWG
jgi:adenylate kinase family enzyme